MSTLLVRDMHMSSLQMSSPADAACSCDDEQKSYTLYDDYNPIRRYLHWL